MVRGATTHVAHWRGFALFAVATLCAVGQLLLPAQAGAATQFWFPGKGWGHGIGMSQYGAQGFAAKGYTAKQIIEYYFTGARVKTKGGNPMFRVLLEDGRTVLEFKALSNKAFVKRGATKRSVFRTGDVIRVEARSGKTCVERRRAGKTAKVFGCNTGNVTVGGPVQTLFTADNGAYGHRYRGNILLVAQGGTLAAINRVRLEAYLKGVVPAEMPPAWHPRALAAQAIAARSYALATRKSGLYDAYSDTRSQMYLGKDHESASTNRAIKSTAGKTAVVGGKIATTFFHSTSGGRTAAIHHVWNTAPSSYLKSRRDPYEKSPYSRWDLKDLRYGEKALRRKLGVKGRITQVRNNVNGSGRIRTMVVVTTKKTYRFNGDDVRWKLGLRSTFFRARKFSIVATRAKVSAGTRVKLMGEVPRAGKVFLMFRPTGTSQWRKVRQVKPRSNGRYSHIVKVNRTGVYRLRHAGVMGPAAKITVN